MKLIQIFITTSFLAASSILCFAQNSDGGKELKNKLQSGKAEVSNYNTACYFALEGDNTLAIAYLKKAVYNDNFSKADVLENDSDLKLLHHESSWGKLIETARENAVREKKFSQSPSTKPVFFESKAILTPYRKNISENEKIAGLSKLWSEVKYNFANFDLIPRLNFDSLYLAYIPKVRQTSSTAAYYKMLIEFCAQLKDGHTNVYVPEDLYNEFYARPLLRTRLIENKVIIVGVYDNALEKKGIKVGQEVMTINGLPVKEYADRHVKPFQSSSTSQDLETRMYEYSLLSGPLTQAIQLELRDSNRGLHQYTVSRVKPEEGNERFGASPFQYKVLDGNIAYVKMDSFATDSAVKAFSRYFKEISKSAAIIFDVRNNGGGSTPWQLLSYLTEKDQQVQSWYARDYQPYERAANHLQRFRGGISSINSIGTSYYNKPVAVLTSSRTFSAAEDFAAAFRSLNRGVIIGTLTGGSTGQPLMIGLPGNGSARICTIRDMFANGDDFVGKGIEPDIAVIPTISDVKNGIDRELETAIKYLNHK